MEETLRNQIAKLATLKIKPYKKFIKKLLEIEDQGLVSENHYRELRALFQGQIMPYMKKENAEVIAENLIAVGRCVGVGNENSRLHEELRVPVLEIVNILMRNMGFGEEPDETIIEDLEKAEDEFFPRIFRQAVKEALDNVLVNHSDYCLLNRGEYERKEDGEYIVFHFLDKCPYGCKIMIGPFTDKPDAKILFRLCVPRYVHKIDEIFVDVLERECRYRTPGKDRSMTFLFTDNAEWGNFIPLVINHREMPLSVSNPLEDSCLIELEQEDCYNGRILSFSFDDRDSFAPYRRNYVEVAFALGQRVKYIFLHARIPFEPFFLLPEYIADLQKIEPGDYQPDYEWKLDEKSGEFVPK
jgi:hypothetical protein